MNQTYEDRRGPQGFDGCLKTVVLLALAVIFLVGVLAGVVIAAVL